jgi:electron transfer flavoprotein alpha/beta subunit
MDRLRDLRKSIADMSLDELREHVRNIRIQRRIVKDKPATKRKKVVASDKSKKKVDTLLGKMSTEQLKALLGELDDGTASSEGSPSGPDQDKG